MKSKGLSEFFGTVIVVLVTLAIAVPLVLYYNSLKNSNFSVIGEGYKKLNNALSTEFTVIRLGNNTNEVYLYNYGKTPIKISQVIVNNQIIQTSFTLAPNQLVPLSSVSSQIPNSIAGDTVIIEANGNYYTI